MIKTFRSFEACQQFAAQSGYHGSKPFRRLVWDEKSHAQIVVWSVQIHWKACKANSQAVACSQM